MFNHFRAIVRKKIGKIPFLALGFIPLTASSGTVTGSSIFSSIWNLILGFLSGILTGIETLLNDIFGGIGGSISSVFSQWGYSVSGTFGVWAPVGLVVVLSAAGAVLYLMIDFFGIEKDIASDEEEI